MASNLGQPQGRNRGWLVTISATVALLMLGALYAWSVVKKAIPEDWGWSTADKAWPYSIALVSFSIFMVVGGRLQDSRTPRLTITLGGLLSGVGLILCGLSTSSLVWLIAFGIIFGAGLGFAYSSGTPPSVKWFPASRTGLISGLVVMGFGAGAVWVAPTMRALIKAYGIQTSMIILGVAVTIVMVACAQLVKAPPPGYMPLDKGSPKPAAKPKPKKVVVDWTPDTMLRSWQFPVLVACFTFAGGAGLVIIGNMASIVTGWGWESYSAIAVSVVAAGNGIFRPIWGKLSDNFGRRPILLVSMVLQFAAFVALVAVPIGTKENPSIALGFALALGCLIGINYGASLAVFPAITKDYYGLKHFGMNYGLVYQGWGIGGFIVSQLAAFLIQGAKDAGVSNTYAWAFYECAAILAAGIVLMFLLRAPVKKNVETAQAGGMKPFGAAHAR